MKKNKCIIIYAIILQLITAAFIMASSSPLLVARLGFFYVLFPNQYVGAFLMIFAAILAFFGLYSKKTKYRFLYFFPQFIFLILTSGSALYAVIRGTYADGVPRPWEFIFIDQLPAFVCTIVYTFSIFNFKKESYA